MELIDNSLLIQQLSHIQKVAYFTSKKLGFMVDKEDITHDIICILLSREKQTTADNIRMHVRNCAYDIYRNIKRRNDKVNFCELSETIGVTQDQTEAEVLEFMATLKDQEREVALLLMAGITDREARRKGKRIEYARQKVKRKLLAYA